MNALCYIRENTPELIKELEKLNLKLEMSIQIFDNTIIVEKTNSYWTTCDSEEDPINNFDGSFGVEIEDETEFINYVKDYYGAKSL